MNDTVFNQFAAFASACAPKEGSVLFEFGVGETFLHYDLFLRAAMRLRQIETDKNVQVTIQVTTNGTLLTKARLEQLAEMGISLTFSIDGSRDVHDLHRKDSAGGGTHTKAIENWRTYRKMCFDSPLRPACNVHSVVTDATCLNDLIHYWMSEGQQMFSATVQLPNPFDDKETDSSLRSRQEKFLAELESWAFAQARRLEIPGFFSQYRGLESIFRQWWCMFFDEKSAGCRAGEDLLCVDSQGNLYPCEAFTGETDGRVGNIFQGVDSEKLETFRGERNRLLTRCEQCELGKFCPRACFHLDREMTMEQNFEAGCRFAGRLAEIGVGSYRILTQNVSSNGKG